MNALPGPDAEWLARQLRAFDAVAGTIHRVDGAVLVLTDAINIPESVQATTQTIPPGKGMAGLAWSRGVPVQTCDLQTDETGDVQPGARAVNAGAAVAVPIFSASSTVRAVVGLAFAQAEALGSAHLARIAAAVKMLPE